MRPLVQLPAKCYLEYLPADDANDAAERVKSEVPVAECRVGIVCVDYFRALCGGD